MQEIIFAAALIWILLLFGADKVANTFFCKIHGPSMFPVLVDGDVVLIKPFKQSMSLVSGKVYLYNLPDGRLAVKRLQSVMLLNGEQWCFFVGDNKAVSKDSRHYGCIHRSEIVSEVTHMWMYGKGVKKCSLVLPWKQWEEKIFQNTAKPAYPQVPTP